MKKLLIGLRNKLECFKDLPPLFMRLVLAYGFYITGTKKLENFQGIIDWFRDGLHLPYPEINAYLATGTECAGFVLLFLGLFTRLISIPLIITMLVAIFTVHYANGFQAGDNGFEIPLYYLLMLFALFIQGPGRISVDALISRNLAKS